MPLIAEDVHIWRDPDGDYHLRWRASHPDTEISVEPLVETAHHKELVDAGARISGLPEGSRHFFRVSDQFGNAVTAPERRLALDGSPNFRDFGGYTGAGGRAVRWGYLFRSGQLSALSERDVAALGELELDLVCDFRRVDEQQKDPSRLPPERPPKLASLPIIPGSNSAFFEDGERDLDGRDAMFDFMLEINRDFVLGQSEAYARMFREILSIEDARLLIHCAAGKDRTGFAAALILATLGVAEPMIMRDYMLTQQFFLPERELDRLRAKYGLEAIPAESIRPMLEVHEDYLAAALAAIHSEFGSLEDYLRDALAVGPKEIEELRRRYLAPVEA